MKNILFTIIFIVTCTTVNAQGKYEAGMGKAFSLWSENKPTEAIAMFERIAQVEKENWLPAYYAANVLITQSFGVEDKSIRNEMLEKAKAHVATAHKISPANSEIHTLEGFLYTSYVAMDPMIYAMQYNGKISDLHAKAIELDPNNPRAHANSIEYEMGAARFFNQDLTPFCKRLEETLVMFDNQKSDIKFAPSYGKERVESVIENCGKGE